MRHFLQHQLCWIWVIISTCSVLAAPPVISNLPQTVAVGEQELGSRKLYFLSITDPNSDNFNCSNTITANAGTATGNEFTLEKNLATNQYELDVSASTACCTFNYATTQSYANTIVCTDSNGESSSPLTLTATIVDNERISIDNVEGSANEITITNPLSVPAEQLYKTITASSQLGNANGIVFNLTSSNPSFNPEFFKVASNGELRTNRELKYLDSGTPVVYLTITGRDTTNQIVVYATQQINLQNQNTIPTTPTLPKTDTQLESIVAGTVLFQISVSDPDSGQTYTYRHTCVPATATDTFEIDNAANFKIATGKSLDYESIQFYNCSIYISDSIHEGGPFIYALTVTNDNEAPTFSQPMHFATTPEGTAGSVSLNPGFTCTDVDAGDTTTYEFQNVNNSDRFSINSAGIITFATTYDIDNSAMPSTVVLTLYCIDSGGADNDKLTGSTQVTITITDANDNEPVFASSAYTITVDQYTSAGSVIGTITATDADSTTNAALTCSGTSGSSFSSYVTVGQDCNIYLSKAIDFAAGTVISYTVLAKDDGTPILTGTTALEVVYRETTTTTTTTQATTTSYNFFDHAENIAMFVLLLLAGLALLGLLTWCLLRMCLGARCANTCDCFGRNSRSKRYPLKRQVTPQTPPQRKFRPPSPEYRQKTPPKIIERVEPRRGLLMAQPVLTSMRPGGFIRTAPTGVPGFYR